MISLTQLIILLIILFLLFGDTKRLISKVKKIIESYKKKI